MDDDAMAGRTDRTVDGTGSNRRDNQAGQAAGHQEEGDDSGRLEAVADVSGRSRFNQEVRAGVGEPTLPR